MEDVNTVSGTTDVITAIKTAASSTIPTGTSPAPIVERPQTGVLDTSRASTSIIVERSGVLDVSSAKTPIMSSMELYMPYEVYSNLVIMLTKYRGVTLDAPALTSEMVTRKMNDLEHIVIRGTRENDLYRPDIISVTILIAPESQYATKTADFKKLWNNVPRAQPGKVVNVMFVSDGILTTHLVKVVAAQRAENPALLVEYHDYEIFMLEIPRHINVSPHTLVADKEVDAFCAREYVPRENFPRLTGTDAMAVWLGLTNGMVVKCLRPSDASGSSIVYRIFRA